MSQLFGIKINQPHYKIPTKLDNISHKIAYNYQSLFIPNRNLACFLFPFTKFQLSVYPRNELSVFFLRSRLISYIRVQDNYDNFNRNNYISFDTTEFQSRSPVLPNNIHCSLSFRLTRKNHANPLRKIRFRSYIYTRKL